MEGKELRVWRNRLSAEKSRRNKDLLIEKLQRQAILYETRMGDIQSSNEHYRAALASMGCYMTETCYSSEFLDSCETQHSTLEPAVF
ncbi:hypothetical protein EON65_08280 [archaeon]|nr:MAG: hypothetical protein EON65_08280 [archaeon]